MDLSVSKEWRSAVRKFYDERLKNDVAKTIPEMPARLFEQQELGNEITRFDSFLLVASASATKNYGAKIAVFCCCCSFAFHLLLG